ncbi:cytochrome P450 [Gautieria morchelliformis]|nr:cytochrome P450 [Gautieria morchelliformis]
MFLDCVFVIVVTILIPELLVRQRIPEGLRLPPGPPRKPVVGNLSDMPTEQEWVTFSQLAKTYGELVHLKVFGKSMMIVSSSDVAYELFERRSSIYSDRGEYPMVNDLMGWDWLMVFMHYGNLWRRYRKAVHQNLHPNAAAEYQPIQLKHTRVLLRRLYETPNQFVEHLRHAAGAIIMEVVYGIKVLPQEDPYITISEKALSALSKAGNPWAFLVDTVPKLKHVPEWVPGAGFRKKARLWRKPTVAMNILPFQAVKRALVGSVPLPDYIDSGTAESSFTASLLEKLYAQGDAPPEQEDVIRSAGSALYAAGAGTPVTSLHVFFLAMVLFPEAQHKAQEELDGVVGNRLPEYEDRESLPYVNALCKEVLRWHPIFPLGVPHRVIKDDVYKDYFIPAGTLVFGNTWTMLHDEATYGADADTFRPERFLTPGMRDPIAAFGYGRRICPGRHMAESSIFMAVASILSVFNITPSKDSGGNDIPVQAAFETGFISGPVSFECTVSPRSDAATRLILEGSHP